MPELNLERAISQSLGIPRDQLSREIVRENLTVLDASSMEIRDLTGLEFAANLEVLVLRNNLIEDLSPIRDLAKLRKLDLSGNRLRSVDGLVPLSGSKMRQQVSDLQLSLENRKIPRDRKEEAKRELTDLIERLQLGPWSLSELNLSDNRLLGLSGIGGLTDLVFLNVSKNSLIDLEGVSQLKSLATLYAQENQLGRIESYVDENKNKAYDLGEAFEDQSGNGKRDTDPLTELRNLPELTHLFLYDNHLSSLDSMKALPKLRTLFASGNKIRDLPDFTELDKLIRLSLSDNQISDLSKLSKLNRLEHLYLVENRITDLRPLQRLNNLRELQLQRNQIADAKPLGLLANLEVLSLAYNLLYDASFVRTLGKLRRLSVPSNCLPENGLSSDEDLQLLRANGCFVSLGEQRKRIVEAETLVEFLAGYPKANQELGDYLAQNGYERLMDYLEDSSFNEDQKAEAFGLWEQALKRGKRLQDSGFFED